VGAEPSDLKEAKAAAPSVPVIANTGVNHDTVESILAMVDGAIVGTALKVDGDTWNPVDPDRASKMMEIVRGIRDGAGAS
jgi:predicted TIM-barrel enzyme